MNVIITRRVLVLPVILLASGLLAACGSASSSTTSSTSAASSGTTSTSAASSGARSARRAQLVACLKQHGVTLPSRPPGSGSSGGGGTSTRPQGGVPFGGGGGFAANPKMRAAFQACGAQFGFGGGGRFRARLSRTAITKYVTCVRQHGYNLPNPNFSGKGPVFPANIRTNAKFQAASKACQSILVPARPAAPPGGTSTNSGA